MPSGRAASAGAAPGRLRMLGQQILNGFVVGGVYALFALGFTLVFGVHHLLNLAHGSVFMVGAFTALYAVLAGLPVWVAFLAAMLVAGLLAVLIDVTAFRPLRQSGEAEFGAIISSIGAHLIILTFAQHVSGSQVLRFPFGTVPIQIFEFMGLRVTLVQLVIAGSAFILAGLIMLLLYGTRFGRRVRAVAGNERAAVLNGINPGVVYAQTFFLSGALAGAAGVLIGFAFNSIQFAMGEPFLLRGFVVVVIGGLGSIPGALVAGLGLGLIQTLTVAYLPSGLTDIIVFSLLFLVLLVRPNGLMGRQAAGALRAQR